MNIYTFLVENAEAIKAIPALVERVDALEDHLGLGKTTETVTPIITPPPVPGENPGPDFDQGDHDELFADGGATERSFDAEDHAELFATLRLDGDEAPFAPSVPVRT